MKVIKVLLFGVVLAVLSNQTIGSCPTCYHSSYGDYEGEEDEIQDIAMDHEDYEIDPDGDGQSIYGDDNKDIINVG